MSVCGARSDLKCKMGFQSNAHRTQRPDRVCAIGISRRHTGCCLMGQQPTCTPCVSLAVGKFLGASLSNGPRQVLASSVTGDERYTFGSNLTVNVCR